MTVVNSTMNWTCFWRGLTDALDFFILINLFSCFSPELNIMLFCSILLSMNLNQNYNVKVFQLALRKIVYVCLYMIVWLLLRWFVFISGYIWIKWFWKFERWSILYRNIIVLCDTADVCANKRSSAAIRTTATFELWCQFHSTSQFSWTRTISSSIWNASTSAATNGKFQNAVHESTSKVN